MILAIILAVLLTGLLIVLFAAYYKTFYYPIKNISETKGPITKSKHPYRDEARVKVGSLPLFRVNLSRRDPMTGSSSARDTIRVMNPSHCSSAFTATTAPRCATIRAWDYH